MCQKLFWPPFLNRTFLFKFYFKKVYLCSPTLSHILLKHSVWKMVFQTLVTWLFLGNENTFFWPPFWIWIFSNGLFVFFFFCFFFVLFVFVFCFLVFLFFIFAFVFVFCFLFLFCFVCFLFVCFFWFMVIFWVYRFSTGFVPKFLRESIFKWLGPSGPPLCTNGVKNSLCTEVFVIKQTYFSKSSTLHQESLLE